MQHILDKVDALAAELKHLLPISLENQKRLDKKFRLEFNYNSNHIEGNTLTYGETELLLIFDDTRGNHTLREYEEMKAHDVAYQLVEELAQDHEQPLTEQNIKNLNKIILVRPFWKEAITSDGQNTRRQIEIGNYKKYPNSVRLANGEIFEYASPTDTPILMQELIEWFRTEEKALHAVTLAAMLHYKFVRIHPFDDGNGRIARLLINFVLLKNGLPPVIIKTSDKVNYLQALHDADTGNYEPFISYIGEQLLWSLDISIKASKGQSIEEQDDLDKKLFLLEKDLEIVNSDEEVKKQFEKDVFFEIYNSWIVELIKKSVPVIQKFNKLFTGTRHYIKLGNLGNIQFINETADEIIIKLNEESRNNLERFNPYEFEIQLRTNYGTFIKGGLNSFGCDYGFDIKFDQIKYGIFIDDFSEESRSPQVKLFERLLHQSLSHSEIEEVSNLLGETIYKHIDYFTKKRGIR